MHPSLPKPMIAVLLVIAGAGGLVRLSHGQALPEEATSGPRRDSAGRIADELFPRQWSWSAVGPGVGSAGLRVADLEGDGQPEFVTTAGIGYYQQTGYWYILRWAGSGYEQVWTSPSSPATLVGFDLVQMDEDPALEVVVLDRTRISVYDGASHELQSSFATSLPDARALAAGDIDGDGAAEVALVDPHDLFVFDLTTGSLEAVKNGLGGKALALGAIDDDAPLEIAIANDSLPGSILDGSSLQVQWSRAAGLGIMVAFGNLDADAYDELVAGWRWAEGVRAFDVDRNVELYQVRPSADLSALSVADVDSDPAAEVLYGDGQWGGVHVLTGNTGVEEWAVTNPGHGVSRIAAGDLDGDGSEEVAWGAGPTSTGVGLAVADGATHLVEWESRDLRGPFHALSVADLEGDGERELVAGSFESNSGYDDGVLVAFDLRQGREVPLASPAPTGSSYGLWRVRAANLDLDPQDEICYSTGAWYTGGITCFDALSHEVQWQVALPENLFVVSLDIQDVDGDQRPEVVAGTSRRTTATPGPYVYCFRGESGWLEWRTPQLAGEELSLLEIGNVDGDADREVVVADFGAQVFVVNGASGLVERGPISLPVTSLALADRDGNPFEVVYAGLTDGTVRAVDLSTGATKNVLQDLGGSVDALAVGNVDGHPSPDVVISVGGRLAVHDGLLGSRIWQSDFLGTGIGDRDSLLLSDLDGDGRGDLAVDMKIGVGVFLTASPVGLPFGDGFESGALRRWSRSSQRTP